MDGVRGCTPTVLLWRDPKLFWGSGDGPVGALLVVAGSTGHRVVAVAGFTTSLLQSNIPPLAMPAGDAEHATRQLWRHYSGVQSSSPVSGAVGAVGGSGGGQGLVCGFSPDLLADLLVPEHAELEMLDLTVGQVRFIGQPVAIVTGGAITSALGLTDPARRATAAAAPAMAAASDAGEGAAPSSCEPSESRSELRALDVVFVLVGAPAAGDEEEYSRAVQAARDASAQLGAALRHEELRAQLVSGDGAAGGGRGGSGGGGRSGSRGAAKRA